MKSTNSLGVLACLLLASVPAAAQITPDSEPRASLAQFVAADAGMYLQLERPAQLSAAFRRGEAWRMLDLLLVVERDTAPDPVRWQDAILADLPGPAATALAALLEERVALAGPAWSRFAEGVILFSVRDRAALDPLLAAAGPPSETREGLFWRFELAGGLKLAFDGQVAVLTRPRADPDFFAQCVKLLKRESTDSLAARALFAEQLGRLPRAAAAGVFYFAPGQERGGPQGDGFGLWPVLRGGVVGVYARGNTLDFALRAAPASPPRADRPRVALQRVHHLPRSTMASWATSADLAGLFDRWLGSGSATAESTRDFAGLLRSALDVERLKRDVVGMLGPRIMLVWGRGAAAEEGRSSLAVMLESTDAEAVKQAMDAATAQLVLAVNRAYARDDAERIRLLQEDYLGTHLTIVELADFAKASKSEGLARRLAVTMRPCYAALDGWIVIAWSSEHLREMIAARSGIRPVLGEFADVGGLTPSRLGATTLAVVQPAAAAAVLGRWLDDAERDPESVLNPRSWDALHESRGRGAGGGLGLGLKPRHRAGRVLVLKVYEDGPSRGLVLPGDEIVAVNGLALALDDANADLRRRLKEAAASKRLRLRLERAGELLEVVVPFEPAGGLEPLVQDAHRALRRVQAVIRPLTLATFAVTQSDEERFSAQLRLRFSESPVPAPASQ